VVVTSDNWSYKSCKAPVKSLPTNQCPTFYRPDSLPVAQPTVITTLKGNAEKFAGNKFL